MKLKINESKALPCSVYIEYVNYLGNAYERAEIARFHSIKWAEDFIEKCCDNSEPDKFRFVIEEK